MLEVVAEPNGGVPWTQFDPGDVALQPVALVVGTEGITTTVAAESFDDEPSCFHCAVARPPGIHIPDKGYTCGAGGGA